MGRYAARRFADLPPVMKVRVDRALAALCGEVQLSAAEIAEAEATVSVAPDSPQRCLDLTPHPESKKVYAPQFAVLDNKINQGKGTP